MRKNFENYENCEFIKYSDNCAYLKRNSSENNCMQVEVPVWCFLTPLLSLALLLLLLLDGDIGGGGGGGGGLICACHIIKAVTSIGFVGGATPAIEIAVCILLVVEDGNSNEASCYAMAGKRPDYKKTFENIIGTYRQLMLRLVEVPSKQRMQTQVKNMARPSYLTCKILTTQQWLRAILVMRVDSRKLKSNLI
uniref:Uncharacterized protein n=1 Tax=Glossina palpalis gambiensis TaxID=67801 RepID=A0A1B0BEY8_9MUSC